MAETPEEEESKKEELLLALLLLHGAMGRVWKRGAVQPARKVFDAQLGKMLALLHKFLGARTRQFLTPPQLAEVYRMIVVATPQLALPLAQVVGDVGKLVVPESAQAVDRLMARMTGRDPGLSTRQGLSQLQQASTNVVQPPYAGISTTNSQQANMAKLQQVDTGTKLPKANVPKTSKTRVSKASAPVKPTIAQGVVEQVQQALANDIAQGVVDRLKQVAINDVKGADILAEAGAAMEDTRWKVERTIRTEAAKAFNNTQATAIMLLSGDFPTMRKRWTELIDDATGQPYDNRVAKDSMALHGQLAENGRMFTMPQDPRAPANMVGASWLYPPNRPNDRGVITPWMPGWPVPVYITEGITRVPVDYRTGKKRNL